MKIHPSAIRLDASTICQLKCPGCNTTTRLTDRVLGSKTLKFENFKNLVDKNSWIRDIELSSQGEIFLNRDLLKIIEYAYEKGITLRAANGVNLNTVSEEVLEGLVKYRFYFISCSIDGASQETYKIFRRGGDLEKVIANIKKINEFKSKYQSTLPFLRWQFIAFEHNEHEIYLAREMAKELGMTFSVKITDETGMPPKNKNLIRILSGTGAASREEYQEKYGKNEGICSQMWLRPQINPDGRVLGCGVNYWGDYGNGFKDDLIGILNNEKMNYARAMLMGKKEEREDIPCSQCRWYKYMKKNNSWLFSREKKSAKTPT